MAAPVAAAGTATVTATTRACPASRDVSGRGTYPAAGAAAAAATDAVTMSEPLASPADLPQPGKHRMLRNDHVLQPSRNLPPGIVGNRALAHARQLRLHILPVGSFPRSCLPAVDENQQLRGTGRSDENGKALDGWNQGPSGRVSVDKAEGKGGARPRTSSNRRCVATKRSRGPQERKSPRKLL